MPIKNRHIFCIFGQKCKSAVFPDFWRFLAIFGAPKMGFLGSKKPPKTAKNGAPGRGHRRSGGISGPGGNFGVPSPDFGAMERGREIAELAESPIPPILQARHPIPDDDCLAER